MAPVTYLEAIRQGIWEEMERDPAVFCIGEDIGIYGGAFKVTEGLIDRFGPQRVVDTPISEIGHRERQLRSRADRHASRSRVPVHGLHQLRLQPDRQHGGQGALSLGSARACRTARAFAAAGVHGGPFHSQNPETYFAHTPGLKVVCPATAYDAKGLIKSAIRDNNPVLFFEHKFLYRRIKEELPAEDYVVPIGQARIAREGRDVSVITYAAMVYVALEAAETLAKEGIELEVIDLRTISRSTAKPSARRLRRPIA